jgi:L-iditol 2-dehydrogenase
MQLVESSSMQAAILYGKEDVRLESVPVPAIGSGELLVRVRTALTCGKYSVAATTPK